jgi:predicted hotdog family 3-hydroxylacyl-ACP dehydratase
MRLDRAWIERHIPHQGRMCLLDEVLEWSTEQIRCRSATHRDAHHPLRAHGRLGIACGIEYAAQAMAVHGVLSGGALAGREPAGAAARAANERRAGSPTPAAPPSGLSAATGTPLAGFLASVRSVQPYVLRLDDVPGDLICGATRLAGDRETALYEFELRSEEQCLLRGRATVVLDATGRLPL